MQRLSAPRATQTALSESPIYLVCLNLSTSPKPPSITGYNKSASEIGGCLLHFVESFNNERIDTRILGY